MNGVHDMGGMHGMGPIRPEENEPVFHARWEARIFALTRALGAYGKWNIDASRHERELIPAAEYLRMSYYEKWHAGLEALVAKTGLLDGSGATPALTAVQVSQLVIQGKSCRRDVPVAATFTFGQTVRARNINPEGHTRLPRYARGKAGTIERDHGVFVFPDTNAHFLGEKPQHVYSVRFAARELWGDQASPRDSVYIDLWDDYLEPA
jgi:nitrile hydratase beta subunit